MRDMGVRAEFDAVTAQVLGRFDATVAAYAGYMSIATEPLINAFLGVNVHPADLSIRGEDGKPKYRGDHAVRDAILAGERSLRSSTHIIEQAVDCGRILMVSAPLEVVRNSDFEERKGDPAYLQGVADAHQNRLKEFGDWEIFPLTLELIARGRYAKDSQGLLYFDGKPIPNGVRREEL